MMKKLFPLLFILVAIGCSKEEPTPEPILEPTIEPKIFDGSIDLLYQDAVERFAEEKYTAVTGWLYIGGPENDITSLESLTTLQEVKGLIIQDTKLENLKGLNNLTVATQGIEITVNSELTSLEGLDKLTSVGVTFSIIDNPQLVDLTGLENFEEVYNLEIVSNNSLQSFDGLENLESIEYKLSVFQNSELDDLCAIRNLVSSSEFEFHVNNNKFNPTKEELAAGNCSA